jgi:hypothetical protein
VGRLNAVVLGNNERAVADKHSELRVADDSNGPLFAGNSRDDDHDHGDDGVHDHGDDGVYVHGDPYRHKRRMSTGLLGRSSELKKATFSWDVSSELLGLLLS